MGVGKEKDMYSFIRYFRTFLLTLRRILKQTIINKTNVTASEEL